MEVEDIAATCGLTEAEIGSDEERQALIRACMADPSFHRYRTFGAGDARRSRALGRALTLTEDQSHMNWPIRKIVDRIERAVAAKAGETIVIRVARQGGKNEAEATLECRYLSAHRALPRSVWIRMAPTFLPQLANSMSRLEGFLREDPILRGRWRSRVGFVYESGHAQIKFISGRPSAEVVGETASGALSIDEAHRIDRGKFDEEMSPFVATTGAPTLLWGVAADKLDLLYEHREQAIGTDRLMEFPASVWCEISQRYATHYESQRRRLGARHIVILTQYDLEDVEGAGKFLNPAQREALFCGDHPRLEGPRYGMAYGVLLDMGGESEAPPEMRDQEVRDSTALLIVEWDPKDQPGPDDYTAGRIVSARWWKGASHIGLVPEISRVIEHWNIRAGCVDARGVGEAVAKALHKRFPMIEAYQATTATVSQDCHDLLARLNRGRMRWWRADPEADPDRAEAERQARWTEYEIVGHDGMRLVKPTGTGSHDRHIDGMKALTYAHHVLGSPPPLGGSGDPPPERFRGRFDPFAGRRERLG